MYLAPAVSPTSFRNLTAASMSVPISPISAYLYDPYAYLSMASSNLNPSVNSFLSRTLLALNITSTKFCLPIILPSALSALIWATVSSELSSKAPVISAGAKASRVGWAGVIRILSLSANAFKFFSIKSCAASLLATLAISLPFRDTSMAPSAISGVYPGR